MYCDFKADFLASLLQSIRNHSDILMIMTFLSWNGTWWSEIKEACGFLQERINITVFPKMIRSKSANLTNGEVLTSTIVLKRTADDY